MICASSSLISSGLTSTRNSLPASTAKLRSTPRNSLEMASMRSSRLIVDARDSRRAPGRDALMASAVIRIAAAGDRGSSEPGEDLATDDRVPPVDVVLDSLADVVEQRRFLGNLLIEADLRGDHARERSGVLTVGQHVVAVRVAIAQRAEQPGKLGVDVGQPDVLAGLLTLVLDLLRQLVARLDDHLLDARRVDTSVAEQPLERGPGDLAANRVEGAEHDRLRGVVDDDVDAGRRLESADVATLPSDDPALEP